MLTLIAGAFAAGLEAAESDPNAAPPAVLFDETDVSRMEAGEALIDYAASGRRDYGFAARIVPYSRDLVWAGLDTIEAETAHGVTVKATKEPAGHGDHWDIAGTMVVDQPVIKGTIGMRGHAFDDRHYVAFHLTDDQKGPFHHAFGYWSAEPYKDGKTLIVLVVDFASAAPVPKAIRAKAVQALLPTLLDAISQ